jgi:hypothetical protein
MSDAAQAIERPDGMSHQIFHKLMKTVPDSRIELLADVGHSPAK